MIYEFYLDEVLSAVGGTKLRNVMLDTTLVCMNAYIQLYSAAQGQTSG